MSTTQRVVRKQLAGAEDLLQGVGIVTQTRGSGSYPIHKLDIPIPTYNIAEMQASSAEFMRLYGTDTAYTDYRRNPEGTIGIPSNLGGVWEPMRSSEYLVCGNFATGAYVFSSDCIVALDQQSYNWQGSVPKVVAAGATPATSGGVGVGAWVDRTDVTLRSELSATDGDSLVGYATYTQIRSYSGSLKSIRCGGRTAIYSGDGAHGKFWRDDADTTSADNDGTILIDALGRRWKRKYSGDISIKWFGATGDGVTDDYNAIQSALYVGAGGNIRAPSGNYLVSQKLLIKPQTGFIGDVTGIGSNETRGTTIHASPSLSDFILENSSLTLEPSNPFWHGGKIENIQFFGNETTRTASGVNIGPCGDNSGIKNVKFIGFNTALKIGGSGSNQATQVSCKLDTITLYSSNVGLLFDSCGFTASVSNLMIDKCVRPVYFKNCGTSFHCNVDQWHAEDIADSAEVFYVENCNGSYHEVRAGFVDSSSSPSTFAIVRINRTTAPNRARVKVVGASSATPSHYILKDDEQNVGWTQSELGLTYPAINHNMPIVTTSGQGGEFFGASFVKWARVSGSSTLSRVESTDSNLSHNIHYQATGAAAGIQFKDGISPYNTYGQFRADGALSQLNLFTTASPFIGTSVANGGFIEQNTINFKAGTRGAGSTTFWTNNIERGGFDSSGNFRPQTDNAYSNGSGALRWSVVYSATGSINTSDENYKQQISEIDNAVLKAWGKVKFYQYKFNDAVAEKGDGARWHFGVIAQRVKDAFESEGLNAFDFGLLCYDEWPDEYEDIIGYREIERVDEFGNIFVDTESFFTGDKKLIRQAGSRYGIRYEEALALECAYLRSKLGI